MINSGTAQVSIEIVKRGPDTELSKVTAAKAMKCLEQLKGCEAHSTVIVSRVDAGVFKKLGINLTCEPEYQSDTLFHM